MAADLNKYNQKRDFEKTFEPEGKTEKSEGYLRFVIQHHMARREHFDLRLEWNGVLLSWAVPKGPSYNTHDKRLAVQVEDHPLEYMNFEGTIPKGEYGGGVVMLWDEGYWEPQGDVDEGLSKGAMKFILKGIRLKGKWTLVRWEAKSSEDKNNWILLKEKDEYAKTVDGISEFTTSVRTGRTMMEIEAGEDEKITRNPFSIAAVQLAKLVKTIPESGNWLYELKYDGYRIMAFVEGNSVRLLTRNYNDYTQRFYNIASSLMSWASGRAMVLDGEMVVTDESGKSDFSALQSYMKNPGAGNLTYIVFDLLALDGVDFRGYPLVDRKEILERLMKDAPKNLYYSRHVRGNGKESFAVSCEANMEGIIGKKVNSSYSGTRNGDWIKIKCDKRQEFIIGGYSISNKKTDGVSSLLLGFYEDGKLIYAGRAGTGISDSDEKYLEYKFESLKRMDSPFKSKPKLKSNEKIIWLEPELIAEIKFAEWTEDNLLRQASFKGIRTDKDPKEIKIEKTKEEPELQESIQSSVQGSDLVSNLVPNQTSGESSNHDVEKPVNVYAAANRVIIEGVKITNPDKVIFDDSEITKEDVIQYYAKVSERMLPYLSNRVLSIVRCPKGISQTCFYKKHPGSSNKEVRTISITTGDGGTEEYFYIENTTGLISEAQMGTLEFHTWGSRVEELEKPDMMVFDLDPDEGMDLSRVRQGVMDIRSILAELSLNSYLKTSGGKGYHVVVPLKPVASWNTVHDFAKRLVEAMEQKWPERYTSNVRKQSRKNKIFIDWIRNGRGATSIAPYSIRARKGAKVSMPISWDELDTVTPDGINMSEALLRITRDDPWKDFFLNNQKLRID